MSLRTKLLLYLGAALVLAGLGFLAGRRTAPAKVITKVETKVEVRIVEVEKVRTVTVQAKAVQRKTHTHAVVTTNKDGVTTTIIDHDTDTGTKIDTRVAESADRNTATSTTTASKSLTIIQNGKDWRVGALVGLELKNPLGPSGFPGMFGAALYGVQAERRVVGPVWAGAWVLTNVQTHYAGISVSVEF